jgi:two-component system, OmpR family, copper resistance phosphate regulon response regulator CusR
MKILLVEDDPRISGFIKIGFENHGYLVDVANDGPIAEKFALSRKYEVIILDVIIPGISGFELCKRIRNADILTPVIILTSLDSVDDKLKGFENGADDYIVKPFSFQELMARIKALNRRTRDTMVKPDLKLADLEIDTTTLKVRRANMEVQLTATEYKILELLLENKYKVMDRMLIAEKIWGFSFNSSTNLIDVHINSLRKKIDKDFDKKLIHTKKGFGYVLTDEF